MTFGNSYNLGRFLDAQQDVFDRALHEISNGKKISHWMWYIFPQLKGLGISEKAVFYGIADLQEAQSYLEQPVLRQRLISISNELLKHKGKDIHDIMGSPDDQKLRSCMTLFSCVRHTDPVFEKVLFAFYSGVKDARTLQLLNL